MSVLNQPLLNREYNPVNVHKALVSTVPMCSLPVILFSNIKLKYFTLFTKGMFCPFIVRRDRWSNLMEEVEGLNLIFIDFYVPAFTPGLH
jgi:hypothetical protein